MTLLGYETTVATLVDRGVPRDKAEARAREIYPDIAAQLDAQVERKANVLEKHEQLRIRQIATIAGCKVRTLSQPRATKQSPGLPDLWIVHLGRGLGFWWETKRQVGGARSPDQMEFAADCETTHTPYGFGDRYDFGAWLTARGITPPAIPTD
jgi:hypothetical protein